MFQLRTYQSEAVEAAVDFLRNPRKKNGLLVLPTGCHAAGTGILMYDGSVKPVESVHVGDLVMGPDSTAREVLCLCQGREMMYRVSPLRGGSPFTVNANHILSLVSTNEGKKAKSPSHQRGGEQTFVTVQDYLKKSPSWKHLRKLHRSDVIRFPGKPLLPLPPWIVGVILGDGHSGITGVSVTSADKEVINDIQAFAKAFWLACRVSNKRDNAAVSLYFTKIGARRHRYQPNPIRQILKRLGMDEKTAGFKFIPEIYKRAPVKERQELLAGLLDTDGHLSRGGFEFVSKSSVLASDVCFVSRSLGLSASMVCCEKASQNGTRGTYYRVHISGNLDQIPCRIKRKQAAVRLQKKNHLRSGFVVDEIGEGDFFGFTLDKDHLYLTDDFVVHHNSGKSLIIANIVAQLDAPCLVLQPSKEILEQNLAKFHAYGYRPAIYSASMNRKSIGEITLATIGSIAGNKSRESKAELFQNFSYIIPDEAHLCGAKEGQYKNFFNEVDAKLLGLTATPFRLHSNSYGSEMRFLTRTRPRIFDEVVYYVQNRDLFDEGYLAKPEYKVSKSFNRSALKFNSTGADYTDESVKKLFAEIGFQGRVVRLTERLVEAGRRNILIFTRFVDEADYTVRQLASKGVVAELVTGETPKAEREAIIQEFRAGRVQVVANSRVLSIGFDFPELDTVVLARPTFSLALYLQMIGRVVRTHPDKQTPWVVDMVSVVDTFGKMEDLTLHENDGKWYYASGDQILTNTYLTSRGSSRCSKCGSSLLFWARHEKTGNMAPIARPKNGLKPNVAIVGMVQGKTIYSVVGVDDPRAEFICHWAQCEKR